MHELTIVKSLVDAAVEEAQRHNATRVTRVNCRIGCLRQVDEGFLCEAFEIAKQGSCASEAVLDATFVGMRLVCRDCAHSAELAGWGFECPDCGSSSVDLSGGDELELTSLELEIPDEDRGPEKKHLRDERQGG